MPIKKILFQVDFSDSCVGAARYLATFAGKFEAEIMLLHVVTMAEHNLAAELLSRTQARLDGAGRLGAAENLESGYLEKEFQRYVSEVAKKGIEVLQAQAGPASLVFINPGNPVR